MKVLLIDNYDSFTFNLYQYIGEILKDRKGQHAIHVVRNDAISVLEIEKRGYDKIVISPGPGDPGNPEYFGVCGEVLTKVGQKVPVFGVCLGMQGMAHFFGGKVIRAKKPFHGKTSLISHDGKGVFKNIPQGIEVMRYHSLVADPNNMPKVLKVTAKSLDSHEIMGLRHQDFPIEGIQFHPESFATEGGKEILKNFLLI